MVGQRDQNKNNSEGKTGHSEGAVRALRGRGVNRLLSFNRQHLIGITDQLCGVVVGEIPRGRGAMPLT